MDAFLQRMLNKYSQAFKDNLKKPENVCFSACIL